MGQRAGVNGGSCRCTVRSAYSPSAADQGVMCSEFCNTAHSSARRSIGPMHRGANDEPTSQWNGVRSDARGPERCAIAKRHIGAEHAFQLVILLEALRSDAILAFDRPSCVHRQHGACCGVPCGDSTSVDAAGTNHVNAPAWPFATTPPWWRGLRTPFFWAASAYRPLCHGRQGPITEQQTAYGFSTHILAAIVRATV